MTEDERKEKAMRMIENYLSMLEYNRQDRELIEMNGNKCGYKQARSFRIYMRPQRNSFTGKQT